MYYYFYKITNNLNNKYYYGVHQTSNINDGYMGSGVCLRRAYNKHGIENFTKSILKYFSNSDDMYKYESEIVTEDLVRDPMCYNLKCGGFGGMKGFKMSDETRKKISEHNASKKPEVREKISEHNASKRPEVREKISEHSASKRPEVREKISRNNKRIWKNTEGTMKGKHHSDETKNKISNSNRGKKRTQEFKQKMSEINKGRHHTEEAKKKISLNHRTNYKPLSDETKRKLSDSHKGKKMHNNTAVALLNSTKNTIWINNGTSNKRIKPTDFECFEKYGWVQGMLIK